jgi:hypothetical protein
MVGFGSGARHSRRGQSHSHSPAEALVVAGNQSGFLGKPATLAMKDGPEESHTANCNYNCLRFAPRRAGIRSGRNRTMTAIVDRTVHHSCSERQKLRRQVVVCSHLEQDKMNERVRKSN